MSKKEYLKKALNWVSKKSTVSLKAKLEGYEDPKIFRNKTTNEEVQPDVSFVTRSGAKSFTEIAMKTETPQKLVTKWKLLSLMAAMKRGRLYLLAPRGHKMFTKKLVDLYNINAVVMSV